MTNWISRKEFDREGNLIGEDILQCTCGRIIPMIGHDVQCGCGQLYNGFGQRLNPPNQWEENDDY